MSHLKIDKYGNKCWYNDKNKLHRVDEPALENIISGTKCWFINGRLHREDGPAIEYSDGDKEWWYNDNCIGMSWHGYTQEDFERYLRELKIKEYW